jgi:uncharacterized protein YqgC (DUF456 family)
VPYLEQLPIGIGALFSAFGVLCILLVVVGLPGTWILIATAVLIDLLDWLWLQPDAPLTFHPLTIAAAVLLGLVGELLEFLLSAAGAKKFGASNRGMLGSVVGGVLGAIFGTVLIWIPIIGTLIGAVCGTAAGAVIGEMWDGRATLRDSAKPAFGAVLGRVLGTLSKLPIAVAVWVLLAVAAFRS